MQPNFILMIVSVLITAVCWGIYGPILHWGQHDMGGGRLRTFICVGVAYFLVAIVVPIVFMSLTRWEMEEKYSLTTTGVVWSLVGGALGAVGALGIILAFTYSPFKSASPLVVMPLVFGLAPVVNTLFTMYMNRGKEMEGISPFFAAGLILTAVGASSVLVFAPKPAAKPAGGHAKNAVIDEAATERAAEVASMTSSSNALANRKLAEELARAEEAEAAEHNTESKS